MDSEPAEPRPLRSSTFMRLPRRPRSCKKQTSSRKVARWATSAFGPQMDCEEENGAAQAMDVRDCQRPKGAPSEANVARPPAMGDEQAPPQMDCEQKNGGPQAVNGEVPGDCQRPEGAPSEATVSPPPAKQRRPAAPHGRAARDNAQAHNCRAAVEGKQQEPPRRRLPRTIARVGKGKVPSCSRRTTHGPPSLHAKRRRETGRDQRGHSRQGRAVARQAWSTSRRPPRRSHPPAWRHRRATARQA